MIKWLDKLVSIVLHLLIPEFPGIPTNFFLFTIPGIPESQLTLACLRMISPGYRLNSAAEFPEL
jgi:hypothetical protein